MSGGMSAAAPPWPASLRALALVPAASFAWYVAHHAAQGSVGNALWSCHLGDALLAVGLAAGWPSALRVATLSLAFGLPLWVVQHLGDGLWTAPSIATHCAGLAIGLWTLRRARMAAWTWPWALAWVMAAQIVARVATPAELNVNLAHHAPAALAGVFASYAAFWCAGFVVTAAALWLLEAALRRVVPLHAARSPA